MSIDVVIVRTGIANLSSITAGLERAGGRVTVTEDPRVVREAMRVMLPGVGAFKAGMDALNASGMADALRERIAEDRSTAGICLGMQLLCASSEESPGVAGLGIVPLPIGRFKGGNIRVPQLGWNRVEAPDDARLLRSGYAYFANSYRLDQEPKGWACAFADHGGRFVAAMERGNVLGCQFHPELSGEYGLETLKRWLRL
ncbi:MAG: imidazole glycerol phosphate synthase subunit HisH [Planctomycetes bacterium]|nr:imidazole glycerol phosphate synthase subunit HisH [Planctomycetota bacterium]NUQ36131.1 imidazole glycerol phosphate synthase subunit HisH [Planctomycetaceae bacterium]